uniref:5'-deoxynucleotidase HDDC2 n=1 Tax=Globodera pallida TaxID=36090 RepID=A0A183BHY9_GLOPA
MSSPPTATHILNLLDAIDKLKHLKRTGWVLVGISEPETVASHMYRMATLAMTLSAHRADLNVDKCIRMALVHDVGEAIIGDITPHCGVSSEEKFRREKKAVETISNWLPETVGNEWKTLWTEYEAGRSSEAKAVKQLDKLDMLAQAFSYEEKLSIDLSEFVEATADAFPEEPFASWAAQIRQKRNRKTDAN